MRMRTERIIHLARALIAEVTVIPTIGTISEDTATHILLICEDLADIMRMELHGSENTPDNLTAGINSGLNEVFNRLKSTLMEPDDKDSWRSHISNSIRKLVDIKRTLRRHGALSGTR
ncbi:hypothetical protein [Desulforegula conservatrix]|uniref:hypothetical protein n=1 Tax=Desulforegula conservatrix TaxID=153026 RepID=UPI00040B5F8C|nr:hypothetical protein [Desulforegula conservatrix]